MGCIRRINLDDMWSIAILTVKSNRSSLKVGIDMSDKIGLSGLYEHISTLS